MLTGRSQPFSFRAIIKDVHRGTQTADTVKWSFKAGQLFKISSCLFNTQYILSVQVYEGLEEQREEGLPNQKVNERW